MTARGQVVVVGSVNTDYVLRVPRRPLPGETVTDAVLEVHPGGKGANQAVAAARSGAVVHLVGRVGGDAAGAARRRQLAAEQVRTDRILATPGRLTGLAVVTLTPDGENDIVVAPGANADLSPADVEASAELIAAAAVFVAQLEVPPASVARAIELAGPSMTVVLNCAPFRPLPASALAAVDVLVANAGEAAALAGAVGTGEAPGGPVSSEAAARQAAERIRAAGPQAVVVTLGAAGALVLAGGLEAQLPAPPVEVRDTTGAGDAFVGALAARLAAGAGLLDAVAWGVAVGSATTATIGALAQLPG